MPPPACGRGSETWPHQRPSRSGVGNAEVAISTPTPAPRKGSGAGSERDGGLMGDTFTSGALRLAALAAQQLGWAPPIFWHATPSELAACLAPPAPAGTPPTRAEIAALIERDADG